MSGQADGPEWISEDELPDTIPGTDRVSLIGGPLDGKTVVAMLYQTYLTGEWAGQREVYSDTEQRDTRGRRIWKHGVIAPDARRPPSACRGGVVGRCWTSPGGGVNLWIGLRVLLTGVIHRPMVRA